MSQPKNDLAHVPVSQIRENPAALRQVDKEDPIYLEMVDSVRQNGVLKPILISKALDEKTGQPLLDENQKPIYVLIDGLHRFNCAKDAGHKTVPCSITDNANEVQRLKLQIHANSHSVVTRKIDYADGLMRYLNFNPLMTKLELADQLKKSVQWIDDQLSLLTLPDPVQKLVNENKIVLTNAYALAKLKDPVEIDDLLVAAQTQSPGQFVPVVNDRVKKIQDAKRKGRKPGPVEFTPVARLQKMSDLKNEIENGNVAQFLRSELFPNASPDFLDGFRTAVEWALHLDAKSVQEAKEEDTRRKHKAKLERDVAAKERADQRAKEAAERAALAQEELSTKV